MLNSTDCHHPRYTGNHRYADMEEGLHSSQLCSGSPWTLSGACDNVDMQIPVLVSDLDLECQLWLKIRLAPMTPYFGTISLAFVGAPTIKVQLLPYNRVRLMRVPVVQVCPPVLISTCALYCTCRLPVRIKTLPGMYVKEMFFQWLL